MSSAQYEYTKIGDLVGNDSHVNIIGIVKYFKPPAQLANGQYHALYTLIDSSVEDNIEAGIRCNLFALNVDDLPKVENIGDIVRFHRMRITMFNSKLQIQKTRGYSWLVYNTRKLDIDNPKSSHLNPTITENDKKMVKELMKLLGRVRNKLNIKWNNVNDNNELTSLADVDLNTFFNCLVQVLDVNVGEQNQSLLLTVSDGTKSKFNSLWQMKLANDKKRRDLGKIKNHAYCLSVFDDHFEVASQLKAGQFILITNLHAKGVVERVVLTSKTDMAVHEVDDIHEWVELIVHSGNKYGRGIALIPPDDSRVTSIKDRIDSLSKMVATVLNLSKEEKIEKTLISLDTVTPVDAEKEESQPVSMQESLTSIDFTLQPLSTIYVIKCHSVPYKFRVRAKVVACHPPTIKECIVNATSYSFRILLEDDTGFIEVIVHAEDAFYFFNNTQPKQLLEDESLMENYRKKFIKFGNFKENIDFDNFDPSTLTSSDFCLYSYKNNDEIFYRLFGTSLI